MACAGMALQHMHLYLQRLEARESSSGWRRMLQTLRHGACQAGDARASVSDLKAFAPHDTLDVRTCGQVSSFCVHLCSFGVSLEEKPYTGTNSGSLRYAAPEMLIPAAKYDRAVDYWLPIIHRPIVLGSYWALGILLFELSWVYPLL